MRPTFFQKLAKLKKGGGKKKGDEEDGEPEESV